MAQVTDEKFTELRVNRGLQRNRTNLWKNHKAVVLTTHVNNPEFKENEVHLIDEQQDIFNKQIFSEAVKMLCSYCKWTIGECIPKEHNNLLERSLICDRQS